MKKQINLLLIIIALLFTNLSNAQLSFGVQLGGNITGVKTTITANETGEYWKLPYKSKFGLNFGAYASYNINEQIGFQTGLLFTQKGYQVDWDKFIKVYDAEGMKIDGKWTFNLNYLEVPVNFYFQTNGIQFYAGPYLAFGIGGKNKIDIVVNQEGGNQDYKEEVSMSAVTGEINGEDYLEIKNNAEMIKAYNAFDLGLNLGVGYQYEQFMIRAQYSFGFSNLTPKIKELESFNDDHKFQNKGFSFSFIYLFKLAE